MGIPMTIIPAEPVLYMVIGLSAIVVMVLVLPFSVKFVEHNLEAFFLVMGALAVTISGQWSLQLIIDALKASVMIGSLPIGIFQVVLIFGLLIHFFNKQFYGAVTSLASKVDPKLFIFILIALLGLLSAVISVIVTAVLIAELVAALPLSRQDRIKLVVVTCYAVGLGMVLTPLGGPLTTIMVERLSGPPYNAGFTFPWSAFAIYIIPGVIATAIFGALYIGRKSALGIDEATAPEYTETIKTIILRAVRVFLFVAAVVLIGEGFKPLVLWYITKIPALAIFWINMVSAILDNAVLTAVEINSTMILSHIIIAMMGLLIAGGMLIPGNIPNIVAAGRLKINMKEWAVIGVPIGLAMMVIYFLILLLVI